MLTCAEQIAVRLDWGVRDMIHAWCSVPDIGASHHIIAQIIRPATMVALPSPETIPSVHGYYICIATGMADFSPTVQDYHHASTRAELRRIVEDACAQFDWDEDLACNGVPHAYAFRPPADGENNYSQRLRISREADCVLDVIGMTVDEYYAQCGGED